MPNSVPRISACICVIVNLQYQHSFPFPVWQKLTMKFVRVAGGELQWLMSKGGRERQGHKTSWAGRGKNALPFCFGAKMFLKLCVPGNVFSGGRWVWEKGNGPRSAKELPRQSGELTLALRSLTLHLLHRLLTEYFFKDWNINVQKGNLTGATWVQDRCVCLWGCHSKCHSWLGICYMWP